MLGSDAAVLCFAFFVFGANNETSRQQELEWDCKVGKKFNGHIISSVQTSSKILRNEIWKYLWM